MTATPEDLARSFEAPEEEKALTNKKPLTPRQDAPLESAKVVQIETPPGQKEATQGVAKERHEKKDRRMRFVIPQGSPTFQSPTPRRQLNAFLLNAPLCAHHAREYVIILDEIEKNDRKQLYSMRRLGQEFMEFIACLHCLSVLLILLMMYTLAQYLVDRLKTPC